ncbi:TonB-dependent receptor [Flammeovirga sp. EKP202]|uniref:TonB-dependent receptor n=1 Tax=Flammeovirga sp. EKP202 TaxID=2770592 RepID=UPI00165EE279|nr:TonB-dependent receptor [Flammeovirga sp. EKP202]MBD0402388.1 TonB-dependent receptor [Flammeovirga sp. EKP202]
MIQRILLLFCSLLLSVSSIYSQDKVIVSGKVIDTQTNKGIPFCTVQLKDLRKGGYTDANGHFRLPKVPLGPHELVVTRTGYTTYSQNISVTQSGISNLVISLSESEVKLDEVMVIGESEKTKMEKQGFAAEKITTEEIAVQSVELNSLLDQTAGITVRREGGLGSNVKYSINGLSGNAVRIFIDGVPMEYFGSSYSLNSLPVNLIEEIEVYKGVVPVELGSDALGGAVNIKTKATNKTTLTGSYSFGSFNTHQASLNGSYRNEKTGLTTRGSVYYNYSDNNYKVWGNEVFVENPETLEPIRVVAKRFNDAYEAHGAKLDLGFTDVKWADQFFVSMVYSDMYKEVQHAATMIKAYGERHFTQSNLAPSISYQKKNLFTKGLEVSLYASYVKNNRATVDTTKNAYNWFGEITRRKSTGGEAGNTPVHTITNEGTWINRANVSYSLNDNNILNFNAVVSDYKRTGYSEFYDPENDKSNDYYKVMKSILGLSYSNTAINSRLRSNIFVKSYGNDVNVLTHKYENNSYTPEYNGTSDVKYSYGLATSFDLLKKLTIQFSAEQAVRLPEPDELFGNGAQNGKANLDLLPEISKNINVGLRYGEVYFGQNSLTLSTNFFVRDVENLIQRETQPQGNQDLFIYSNFGEILSKGVDFQANYEYGTNLEVSFAGSYNDTRYWSDYDIKGNINHYKGARLKNMPYLQFNSSVRYNLSELIKNKGDLTMYYNMRYIHEYYRHWKTFGHTNKDMIPTQFVNDIGATYRFPKNKLVVSMDLKNIFNEQVFDNFAIQQPGRSIFFKVNYTIL